MDTPQFPSRWPAKKKGIIGPVVRAWRNLMSQDSDIYWHSDLGSNWYRQTTAIRSQAQKMRGPTWSERNPQRKHWKLATDGHGHLPNPRLLKAVISHHVPLERRLKDSKSQVLGQDVFEFFWWRETTNGENFGFYILRMPNMIFGSSIAVSACIDFILVSNFEPFTHFSQPPILQLFEPVMTGSCWQKKAKPVQIPGCSWMPHLASVSVSTVEQLYTEGGAKNMVSVTPLPPLVNWTCTGWRWLNGWHWRCSSTMLSATGHYQHPNIPQHVSVLNPKRAARTSGFDMTWRAATSWVALCTRPMTTALMRRRRDWRWTYGRFHPISIHLPWFLNKDGASHRWTCLGRL